MCIVNPGKWKWTDVVVYKSFVSICYICKYIKVHLRLIFIRFICGICRHLNKNEAITVPYDFWRLSGSEPSFASPYPASPLLVLVLLASTLLPKYPFSVSLSFYPLFSKELLFSHLLLLYIPLPFVGIPFSISLVDFFFLFSLAQVSSLTPPNPARPPLCVAFRALAVLLDCIIGYESVSVSLNSLCHRLREGRDLGISFVCVSVPGTW